jgi:hypothetical protein
VDGWDFLLAYNENKKMKETRYRYFEDLASIFFFEQVITHHYS